MTPDTDFVDVNNVCGPLLMTIIGTFSSVDFDFDRSVFPEARFSSVVLLECVFTNRGSNQTIVWSHFVS